MAHQKYKYVSKQVSRHGRIVYYFIRDRTKKIRLPDTLGSKEFNDAYTRLMNSEQDNAEGSGDWRRQNLSFDDKRKQRVGATIERIVIGARRRAVKAGLPCEITYDWAISRVEAAGFKCELTGIPFFSEGGDDFRINPFAPSLDRKDPRLGYTKENVRIVVYAINVMLLDWGVELMEKIINCYHYQKRTK